MRFSLALFSLLLPLFDLRTTTGQETASPPAASASEEFFEPSDFAKVEKIDIHVHIHCEDLDFVAMAKRDRFRFLNMAVWSNPDPNINAEKHRTVFLQYEGNKDRIIPVVSFPLENWDDADWSEQTIAYLKEHFDRGAVGVKIWKNIGMTLRDQSGDLVMVDDPKLDPVIRYIQQRGRVLLGHLGEPKNCWLPLAEMTTNNDRSYFRENPQYHMYLHPELPSYEAQIDARDRMLAKHPELTFIGCHLASLEWSVDEIAAFLDRFPNAVVGVAARMGQIQYQSQKSRDQVVAFFLRYQDRILYGTDTGIGRGDNMAEEYASTRAKWMRDWNYFSTNKSIAVPELDKPVTGLRLPKSVIQKIYYHNAKRIFDQSWN
ncbi:MAG: amidohydrolase family protein [Planctomycetota bacterium]